MLEPVIGFNFEFCCDYFSELKRSMSWLAKQENTIFIGQAVEVPGTAMSIHFPMLIKRNYLSSWLKMQMGLSLD